jgi:integrase
LVGVLALGGLRLAELAALRWQDLDVKAKLISIVDTELHELKAPVHQRVVRPLWPDAIWPLLARLRMVTEKTPFVFPFLFNGQPTQESWLVPDHDKLISRRLTQRLLRFAARIGLGKQLPLRARRFCQTEMLATGLPESLVNLMLGHSADVGRSHYTNAREVILRALPLVAGG